MCKIKAMLATIMVVVMMLGLGVVAHADEVMVSGDFSYVMVGENELTIVGYSGQANEVVIPAEVDGYKVLNIGAEAFMENESVQSVIIPDSLYKVENSAFEGCKNLSSVSFGANTKWIASRAFAECPALSEVELPKNIKILGSEAFLGTGITEVYIPKSMIETHYDYKTGNGPFGGSGLNTVVFEDGVSVLGRGIFAGAESLVDIEIPDTVTEICDCALQGTGVVDVTIPDSVTKMGMGVFKDCMALKSVKLSESSENIGAWMFADSSLESLDVPKSVSGIGSYAFSGCTNLKSVIMTNWVMSLGGNAFENCTALEEVILSNSLLFIEDETFLNCTSLKELVIPFRVHTLRDRAFKGCTGLEKITVSRSVGTVDEDVFDWNTGAVINTFSGALAQNLNYRKIPFVKDEVKAESLEVVTGVPSHLKLGFSYQTVVDILPLDFTQGVSISSSNESLLTINERGKLIASSDNSGDVVVTFTVGNLSQSYDIHVGYYMGDANRDYKITAKDALAVLKHAAGVEKLKSTKFADVNYDKHINAEDALAVLKIAAGIY